MIKQKTSYLMIGILLIILTLNPVNAFFTRDHLYWSSSSLNEIGGPVSSLCSDKIDIVLDGNTAADIFVLHYTDKNKVKSYISTHTRGSGYDRCLSKAGSDVDLRCFCYGVALHNVQDHFAHTEGGLVPRYIMKYFSSNIIGHMAIENSFELKMREHVKTSEAFKSGRLDYYDDIVLNNLFEQTGGDIKYIELLSSMTGLSVTEVARDANLFANGYKGKGFYATVYEDKVGLPAVFWFISLGMVILGIGLPIVFLVFPSIFGLKTRWWKWLFILIYILIAFVGMMLIISIFTNTTWEWVRISLKIVPIKVSDADISYYDRIVREATDKFIKTGVLLYDDNSGLSYQDRDGNWVEGALGKAEIPFTYVLLFAVMPFFALLNIFLIYKTFSINPKSRNSLINKMMNMVGWFILSVLALLFIGWLLILIFV